MVKWVQFEECRSVLEPDNEYKIAVYSIFQNCSSSLLERMKDVKISSYAIPAESDIMSSEVR